jgi:hypothetical protein
MPQMIFVSGPPHSGTTLTATVIGVNSRCYLIPSESGAYFQAHIQTLRKPFVRKVAAIESEFVVEKTPHHIFNINKIKEDFSDGKFIVTMRNPIDIVGSLFKTYDDFNFSVYTCSDYLSSCISAMNSGVYLIEYEDIIENFDKTISDACEYIGIDFEDRMKNFHEHSPLWFEKAIDSDEHLKRRSEQMRQPLFDGRGIGNKILDSEQIDQVLFDCADKYELITGKVLAVDSE